jgi:hypothetical protein
MGKLILPRKLVLYRGVIIDENHLRMCILITIYENLRVIVPLQ